jgi:hypothetical protein
MKILHASVALAAVMLAGAAIKADDDHDGDHNRRQEFKARLSGDNEVPPVETDSFGRVEIVFNKDETKAEYHLTVRKGVRVTQSHIHCAPDGVNGPVVVFLAGLHARGWDVDGSWIENATITDDNVMPPPAGSPCPQAITNLRELAQAIRDGNTYANVHTIAHPGGEIRGQLRRDGHGH